MTCRDLICYILQNGLEDEPVIKDGKFVGLLTLDEAAVKLNVGKAAIRAMIQDGNVDGFYVETGAFVFDNI